MSKSKKLMQKLEEAGPEVGIFWIYMKNRRSEIIQLSEPVRDLHPIIDFIEGPYDHYSSWDKIKTVYLELSNKEYDEVRRGRVVYNSASDVYYVYTSRKDLNKYNSTLISKFKLPKDKVEFYSDLHYTIENRFDLLDQ